MSKDPRLDTILRVIQFVESNLRSTINVKNMAAEAGYSPYYFCALFNQFTKHSPYDYLIRRRMTEAGKQLISSDYRVVDIAYEFQFESHEGFTRAFRRIFGSPPNTIKKSECLPYLACLEALTEDHLACLENIKHLPPIIQIVRNGVPTNANPVPIQTCWPDNILKYHSANPQASHVLALELESSEKANLSLDWLLHTWLFFSPYQLSGSEIWQITQKEYQIPLLLK